MSKLIVNLLEQQQKRIQELEKKNDQLKTEIEVLKIYAGLVKEKKV